MVIVFERLVNFMLLPGYTILYVCRGIYMVVWFDGQNRAEINLEFGGQFHGFLQN